MSPNSLKRYRKTRFKIGEKCFYCQRVMATPNSVEANLDPSLLVTNEHIYPKSKNGPDDRFNIKFACYKCNQLRGNMNFEAFEKFAQVVLRKYPNAPTILLRNALRQYIDSLVEVASKNNQALNRAASLALLRLADESIDYISKER